MIFYEHRKGLKLLFENLFPKFDFVRVKKTLILFNDDDIINNAVETINKYIFDDDDDQKNDKTSINNITSSSINKQNNDLGKLILKEDSHQATFNHYKKDSQFRLSNNNNERTSFSAIDEILKISNERRIIEISISQIEFNSISDVIIINSALTLILKSNV